MITFGKFNLQNYEKSFIVTDDKLAQLYGLHGDNVFLLPQGEQAKNFVCVQQICSWLLKKHVQKDDTLVAIGGGSVGDTVGFAASVFKRGIKLLHVPTTLVAQLDSSIGGKTALDLDGVKNAVGTIYFADTLVDTSFLQTLDEAQLNNGMGELLKYRMLDSSLNKVAQQGDLPQTVRACAEFKQNICNADPWDADRRKILNFGHTVGHAMELALNIPHGQAVANGLVYETRLAVKLGMCSEQYLAFWQAQVEQIFPILPLTRKTAQLMQQDKKNLHGKVCFVLPCGDEFVLKYLPAEEACRLLCDD